MLIVVNLVVFALLIFGALALSSSGAVLGSSPAGDDVANRTIPH